MQGRERLRDPYFWIALIIIVTAIVLALGVRLRWFRLHVEFGPLYYHHWFTWTGTSFIALFTPAYAILKRRYTRMFRKLQHIHVLGNLLAFTLISLHFTQQMSRPPETKAEPGTGLALYATLFLLVLTGFLRYFQFGTSSQKYWRFIHVSVTSAFYLIIIFHILHGLEIL